MHLYGMSTVEGKIMHITRHTDFALRALIYLAARPEGELVQIRQICELFDVSINHLSKIVNELAKSGYVESQRGRSGGIRLGKPPQDINVGDLVRLMEPTLTPINCNEPRCILLSHCRFKSVLNEACNAFIETIDKYTLADLIDGEVEVLRGLEK
jgi:Rrf2 family nitric oxide-sensitive transcriptional repressor